MKILPTSIEGVFIIEPTVVKNENGYSIEEFDKKEFENKIGKIDFVQENESMSVKGVIRGLHFQKPPFAQAKLVRCVRGKVLDVALDIRKESKTYGQYVAVELTEDNFRQYFIPKGVAHGFAVLSNEAIFHYKCDNYYHPEAEGGISIMDESLDINWRVDLNNAIISDKDKSYPFLKHFKTPFYE